MENRRNSIIVITTANQVFIKKQHAMHLLLKSVGINSLKNAVRLLGNPFEQSILFGLRSIQA